jgi:uncharacterized repeat protein (TIGR02543 family)
MKKILTIATCIIVTLFSYACADNSIKVTIIASELNKYDLIISKGDILETLETPVNEGYQFMGWFEDESTSSPYDFSIPINSDVTISAEWSSDDLEFRYDSISEIYVVSLGNASDVNIIIPRIYNGKPVEEIGDYGFMFSSIESIIIPSSIKIIGIDAFRSSSLSKVEFKGESNLHTIKNFAFSNTLLTAFNIPRHVNNIGYGVLSFNSSLISIDVDENNPSFISDEGILYSYNKNRLVSYPGAIAFKNYVIDNAVKTIDPYAFSGNLNIEYLTLGNDVLSVGILDYQNVQVEGYVYGSAFFNTKNLLGFEVSENNNYFISIEGVLFSKNNEKIVAFPTSKSNTYIVPNDVSEICLHAFNNVVSFDIYISSQVSKISTKAFDYATDTHIWTDAFNMPSLWIVSPANINFDFSLEYFMENIDHS